MGDKIGKANCNELRLDRLARSKRNIRVDMPLGINDKLNRLLVRLHQSENCLQPRDHITGLQDVLLLSDVAREGSGDGICQCARLFVLLESVAYGADLADIACVEERLQHRAREAIASSS